MEQKGDSFQNKVRKRKRESGGGWDGKTIKRRKKSCETVFVDEKTFKQALNAYLEHTHGKIGEDHRLKWMVLYVLRQCRVWKRSGKWKPSYLIKDFFPNHPESMIQPARDLEFFTRLGLVILEQKGWTLSMSFLPQVNLEELNFKFALEYFCVEKTRLMANYYGEVRSEILNRYSEMQTNFVLYELKDFREGVVDEKRMVMVVGEVRFPEEVPDIKSQAYHRRAGKMYYVVVGYHTNKECLIEHSRVSLDLPDFFLSEKYEYIRRDRENMIQKLMTFMNKGSRVYAELVRITKDQMVERKELDQWRRLPKHGNVFSSLEKKIIKNVIDQAIEEEKIIQETNILKHFGMLLVEDEVEEKYTQEILQLRRKKQNPKQESSLPDHLSEIFCVLGIVFGRDPYEIELYVFWKYKWKKERQLVFRQNSDDFLKFYSRVNEIIHGYTNDYVYHKDCGYASFKKFAISQDIEDWTYHYDICDVSNGRCDFPIPLENRVDCIPYHQKLYIDEPMIKKVDLEEPEHIHPKMDEFDHYQKEKLTTFEERLCLGLLEEEKTGDHVPSCPCWDLREAEYMKDSNLVHPYDENGELRDASGKTSTTIFECGTMCYCNVMGTGPCKNKFCQRLPFKNVVIVKCAERRMGWGLRCLTTIKRGTFFAEYTGEIIEENEAETRGRRYDKEGLSFLFNMRPGHLSDSTNIHSPKRKRRRKKKKKKVKPLRWVEDEEEEEEEKEEEEEEEEEEEQPQPTFTSNAFSIDAYRMGNFTRFINHNCDPNLLTVNFCVGMTDVRASRIALFARKDIRRGELLSFDYGYAQLKDGKGSIPCLCKAKNCRRWLT